MVNMNRAGLGVVLLALAAVACDSAVDQDARQDETTAAGLSGAETLTVETASGSVGADSTGSAQAAAEAAETTTADDTNNTSAHVTPADSGSSSGSATTEQSSTSVESSTGDSSSSSGGNGASASTSSGVSLTVGGTYDSSLSVVADAGDHQCSQVDEIVDLQVSGVLLDQSLGFSSIDLTAQAILDLQAHANLQIVSHGDKNISVRVTSPDILDLVFSYENQLDMIYISAVSPNTAKPVILKKKHGVERCSYALYTDTGCAVVASDIGLMSASVDNVSITADGCTLSNPAGIPVIELED